MADNDEEEMLRQERQALRLLCSNLIRPRTRMELCELLEASLFQDALYRVAFEEIQAAGAVSAARLRESLPARITNRGFPDFDMQSFLGQGTATESEVEDLFLSVLRLIRLRQDGEEGELRN